MSSVENKKRDRETIEEKETELLSAQEISKISETVREITNPSDATLNENLTINNEFAETLFGTSNTFGFSGTSSSSSSGNETVAKKPFISASPTLCYVPSEVISEPRTSSLYTGPTSWAQTTGSITDAMMHDADRISSIIESNNETSIFFKPPTVMPHSLSSFAVSHSSPLRLRYSIHIFEGRDYPFKGYGAFLKRRFEQVLMCSVGDRICMDVTYTMLDDAKGSDKNNEYRYNITLINRDNFGDCQTPEVTREKKSEIKKYKNKIQRAFKRKSDAPILGEIEPSYITDTLKDDYSHNLTVMVKTKDISGTDYITSLIILNNGDANEPNQDNNTQCIDVIANNPKASTIPFLRSTAMALLFTTIRDTTILSSYIPDLTALSPEQNIKNYIFEFLKYCNANNKKPDSITEIVPGPIEYISTFNKLTLSAVSWEVAEIYERLGFKVTEFEDTCLTMELKTDAMLSTVSNVNRYGFIFNLLQELSLDKLNVDDISATLIAMIEKRNEAIQRLSGKPTDSVSTLSIRGGKIKTRRRKTRRRRSHKRKTHRRRP
jgi:hypothetical protein